MESAPHVIGSWARQRGCEPPPHSSSKITLSPALLNIAECKKEKLGSETAVMRLGCTGSRMSRRMPTLEQAPAAKPSSGYAVISWQPLTSVGAAPSPCRLPTFKPFIAPVLSSEKMRGLFTTLAVSGCASGTWITTMVYLGVLGSSTPPPEQPGSSSGARTFEVPETYRYTLSLSLGSTTR